MKDIPLIQDEKSLWVNASMCLFLTYSLQNAHYYLFIIDMEHLVNVVGAVPAENVDPYNLDDLIISGQLEEELTQGIDYFVEADPVQYMSRVQLRGTQYPPYFPGE